MAISGCCSQIEKSPVPSDSSHRRLFSTTEHTDYGAGLVDNVLIFFFPRGWIGYLPRCTYISWRFGSDPWKSARNPGLSCTVLTFLKLGREREGVWEGLRTQRRRLHTWTGRDGGIG